MYIIILCFSCTLTLQFCSSIRKEHKKCEFQVHEVYAIDILMSSGEGKAKEREARTTVYKKTDIQYSLKMKASRGKYCSLLLCPSSSKASILYSSASCFI